MSRKLCITAIEGNTGSLIADLLLNNTNSLHKIRSIASHTLYPDSPKCKELKEASVNIVEHKPGKVRKMVQLLKSTSADTIMLIPPVYKNKVDITTELVEAAKQANIPNVYLLSSVRADLADKKKQPRLREFISIENMVIEAKGDPNTETGYSLVVIWLKKKDVALVAAYVLSGYGKHGFADKHCRQLIVLTGPMLAAGNELAEAASQALGTEMKFEDISKSEAKQVLKAQADTDESEIEYLLEYYSLVKEGKTNYISTLAFHDIIGQHSREPMDFFKVYAEEFKPKHANKKRKKNGK